MANMRTLGIVMLSMSVSGCAGLGSVGRSMPASEIQGNHSQANYSGDQIRPEVVGMALCIKAGQRGDCYTAMGAEEYAHSFPWLWNSAEPWMREKYAIASSRPGSSVAYQSDPAGSYSQQIGARRRASSTWYQQIGNSTFGSDGSMYQRVGNFVFGDDGSMCQRVGSLVFCD